MFWTRKNYLFSVWKANLNYQGGQPYYVPLSVRIPFQYLCKGLLGHQGLDSWHMPGTVVSLGGVLPHLIKWYYYDDWLWFIGFQIANVQTQLSNERRVEFYLVPNLSKDSYYHPVGEGEIKHECCFKRNQLKITLLKV